MKKHLKKKREYKYWQAFYMCWFNRQLYVDVGNRWNGLAINYFLITIIILTLPLLIQAEYKLLTIYQEYFINPFLKMPKLYITHGLVSCDKPMPYAIKDKNGDPVIIIDVTGTTKTIKPTDKKLYLLIKRDRILYIKNPQFIPQLNASVIHKVYTWKLSQDLNQIFISKSWMQASYIIPMKWILAYILYMATVMIIFSMLFVLFLVLALLCQFLSKLFLHYTLSYKQAVRFLCIASTPSLTCALLQYFMFGEISLIFRSIYFVMFAIYFNIAVYTLKAHNTQLTTI